MKCNVIVAHNIWFDSRMIRIECRRNYKKIPYIKMMKMFYNSEKNHVNNYCTMMQGMKYCSLKKWPRLANLYELLFEENIEEYKIPLHNSLVDTLVCLRCYLKLFQNIEIEKREFENYIHVLEINPVFE
jgi:DNA polymerase III epsilon subunit-like protein